MQVKKFGVVLKSLMAEDLELVRSWRNADHVRQNMQYRKLITKEMQQRWFQSLDKKANLYFIILVGEKKIGVVNLKEINSISETAEAGVFLGDTNYLNSHIPVLATISLMDLAFGELKLKTLKAKIGTNNKTGIAFNESIGYRKCENQSDLEFNYYDVNESRFLNATKNIRTTLEKLNETATK